METKLQKLGNSSGLIIPKPIMMDMDLKPGDSVLIDSKGGSLWLRKKSKKKTLDDILSECDMSAPEPENLWENVETVGGEIL